MWRHLSIVVVALKTVVQSVRSNRWRFNFERARRGGQINFLWKMAMIITITKASILIIWPFPRGLLLTHPISPPPSMWRKSLGIWLVISITATGDPHSTTGVDVGLVDDLVSNWNYIRGLNFSLFLLSTFPFPVFLWLCCWHWLCYFFSLCALIIDWESPEVKSLSRLQSLASCQSFTMRIGNTLWGRVWTADPSGSLGEYKWECPLPRRVSSRHWQLYTWIFSVIQGQDSGTQVVFVFLYFCVF